MNSEIVLKNDSRQAILFEQIKTVNKSAYFILVTYAITAIAFAFIMWDVVSHTLLIVWGGVLSVILCLRAMIHYIYSDKLTAENARKYGYYIIAVLGITGLTWGIGVMLMFPDLEQGYQFFIMFIIAGIGGSAFSSNTIFLQGLYAFFPALLLPLGIRMFFMEDSLYLAMGSVTIVFMVSLYFFSRNLNRSLVETLALRFENSELVAQLRIQKDEAENANIAKSKFLAAASHDLRQPLHALMLNATVLGERKVSSNDTPVIDNIINSVSSLESLFDALLDISKLDAGVVTPDISHFKLQEILDRLNVDCQSFAYEKGLLLEIPASDLCVYSDPVLLERILRNIITNGIRYTENGCVGLVIEQQGKLVNFKIIDTGIGVNEKDIEHIFDEFFQLDNPERDRSKGLGLGLSIVKRLCELLDSSIQVESSVDKGSVFSFSVPAGNIELASETRSSAFEYIPKTLNYFIVIIDDEKSIRVALQILLESWHCTVLAFASEEEALNKLNEYEYAPDVLLVDYRLRKNKTGIDAIAAINNLFAIDIPALIITGDTASDRLKEVQGSGYQLLHKPLHPSKLRVFLQNLSADK